MLLQNVIPAESHFLGNDQDCQQRLLSLNAGGMLPTVKQKTRRKQELPNDEK